MLQTLASLKIFCDFRLLARVTRKIGRDVHTGLRRGVFSSRLLDADDFIAQLLEGHSDIFRRGVIGKMPDNSFYRFISFSVKGKEGGTFLN
jgi:hypothetical protein